MVKWFNKRERKVVLFLSVIILLNFWVSGCKRKPAGENENISTVGNIVQVQQQKKEQTKEEYFDVKIEKKVALPNTTGLQIGFWANYTRQNLVLADMGKRPIGRVDFTGWDKFEVEKGVYEWGDAFKNVKRSHRFGETPIYNINISFSEEVVKKNAIPKFYRPRITYPETREAAKKFLYAYVQELLSQTGSVMLCIDYEIIFNYKIYLKKDIKNANEWRDWYVEAAEVARKAAADIGKSEHLKLIPIVNGNPLKNDSIFQQGIKFNKWLIDVVNASDYLGLDTYHWDPSVDVTDPKITMDIIKFWIDNYSQGKGVIVCENGFSAISEINPNISATYKDKYAGNEAQQKLYFENLFKQIQEANKPDGIFKNQLRGFNIWCYTDNHIGRKGEYEIYFGSVRQDGSKKPANYAIKEAIKTIENDDFHRPYIVDLTIDVTAQLNEAKQVIPVSYNSGIDFEFIRCIYPNLKTSNAYKLSIKTVNPGSVLVNVNGELWLHDTDSEKQQFEFDLSKYLKQGQENVIDLYFTSEIHPFTQQVEKISLHN